MASPAYEQILAVQAHDLTLQQLQHRHRTHPARAQVEALEAERSAVSAERETVASRRHDLERGRKRCEDEASQLEDKRSNLDKKLYGGEVTATKELLAIQEEMAALVGRRTTIEDEELAIMEQLEAVDSELSALDGQLSVIDRNRESAHTELGEALADINLEIERITDERSAAAEPANPELLARYEELREQFDGVAVARLVNGACDGCHIAVSAVAADQMARMDENAVVTCEECGRLLVR